MKLQSDLLEPEDLLNLQDEEMFELLDGMPMEKPRGARSDEIAGKLIYLLAAHIFQNKLGHLYGAQTGYQCFPDRPRRVRKPDASFVASGRLTDETTPDGFVPIAPDLAVEVISPKEKYEYVEIKVRDYRSAGVKLIWIISPKCKTVMIRRLDGTCTELTESGELSGETVVPGFTCKVTELFV